MAGRTQNPGVVIEGCADETPQAIRVCAPARLHLGFLDMNGGLGRRFGSVGLTIDAFATRIRLQRRPETGTATAAASSSARAQRYLERCSEAWGVPVNELQIVAEELTPQHMGLGSGTQMALAVGTALAHLAGQPRPPDELAALLDRGARSSTGLGAFTGGGLILDGGRKRGGHTIPPLLARHEVPRDWRVVLILDDAHRGLHGEAERSAFSSLPAFPPEEAAHLCRVALMQLLPAVQENDIEAFGEAVTTLQDRVGDHFSQVQGGRYTSKAVATCLEELREHPAVTGVGQSSWGPTGFGLVGDPETAEQVRAELAARHAGSHLHFVVAGIRNAGARIERTDPLPAGRADASQRSGVMVGGE